MKNLLKLLSLLLTITINAQVAIGKEIITNTSVSLEFGNVAGGATKQKGLLLPWVTAASNVTTVVPGTLIFDANDKKVKYYKSADSPTNPYWLDLSVDGTGSVDTTLQDPLTENTNAKVSIGIPTSTPGILVLEETNKAMILPLVDKYSSVINPSPGMIVYDLSNNMFCVFNGTVWSFWKS